MKLTEVFYQQPDVVEIARQLLGKVLTTRLNGVTCRVMITETEAYAGITDKASHAYGNRFTNRTKIMYEAGGTAYVYLCYGIHHLFNVVTNVEGIPHAVLIRAGQPLEGEQSMLKRRKMKEMNPKLSTGPGALSQAMGIHTKHSGLWLLNDKIWIEDAGIKVPELISSPRVGVGYAQEDTLLPYRFYVKNSNWVSKTK
ncbi:MAG: DNA-3-methyladenine glycosylase [Bacteroidia bacterium]|nr:DNA-3-methyladenine glycosylase [Bacteroidia bacterium]